MVTSPFVEVISATPEPYAMALTWRRFQAQRTCERGSKEKWGDRAGRIAYRVFFLVADGIFDGNKDVSCIARMLHCEIHEVQHAITFLEDSRLITVEVHRKEREVKENTLDTALLKQDFDVMKDDGPVITSYFYKDFSQRGRDTFFTDEIADLFGKTDWQRQYTAFWGSLAGIMTVVLSGVDIAAYLRDLGRKHSTFYHVLPGYYGLAGQSLIETFRWYHVEYRKIGWPPALQDAWVTAYTLVSSAMLSEGDTGQL